MRTFLRAIGGFFLGLIATYLVVVFGMFEYASLNHIADHDGGMSMGIVFIIDPLAGILGGIMCAIVVPLWLGRRDRTRAAGQMPPKEPWPLPLRVTIAALTTAIVVYWVIRAVLWLKGPMSFSTYWAAYAVGSSPIWFGLAAAAIAALLVYRNGQPQK